MRPGNCNPRRPACGQADGLQGRAANRRVPQDLPQGQTVRRGEVDGSHLPRTGHHDPGPPHRCGNGTGNEDRRRGIPGRRLKGHLLLHRRRPRGLPPAHQGVCRGVPYPYRDEADRRPPGSGAHRRHRRMRPRTLLCPLHHAFQEHIHFGSPCAGLVAESAETGRPVRQAQMLPQLRSAGVSGCRHSHPPRSGAARVQGRTGVAPQDGHPRRDHVFLVRQDFRRRPLSPGGFGCDGDYPHEPQRDQAGVAQGRTRACPPRVRGCRGRRLHIPLRFSEEARAQT